MDLNLGGTDSGEDPKPALRKTKKTRAYKGKNNQLL